jgi:hypothetical protein
MDRKVHGIVAVDRVSDPSQAAASDCKMRARKLHEYDVNTNAVDAT